jgi:hypothetical protein
MDPSRRDRRRLISLVVLMVVALPTTWYALTYRSRRAVRQIRALNGLVHSTGSLPLPLGGRMNYGPQDIVYFLGPQTGDRELEVLRDVPSLRILTLTNTRVTDEGLAQLGRFPNLNCLYIGNIDHRKLIGPAGERLQTTPLITGKGLERLKDLPHLQVVQIIGSPTTDEDLKSLKGLKHLELLDLKDTKATASGVAELKKSLPNCKMTLR